MTRCDGAIAQRALRELDTGSIGGGAFVVFQLRCLGAAGFARQRTAKI